jgi:hypothetical protein
MGVSDVHHGVRLEVASPIGVMRVQPHSHDIILAMWNFLAALVVAFFLEPHRRSKSLIRNVRGKE